MPSSTLPLLRLSFVALAVGPGACDAGESGSPAWPHEPAGFTMFVDQPWDSVTTGWEELWGTSQIAQDPGAPASPENILQITYPSGFGGGSAPVTEAFDMPGTKAIFIGTWWKPSTPWQGHSSNVNKIQFLFPSSGGDIYMAMYGPPGGPYEIRVLPQFPGLDSHWLVPNKREVPVTLGQWHKLEWLVAYTDAAQSGVVKWWVDGALVGEYLDVPFPTGAMVSYKISPTWGGIGDTKSETDHFWYDHTYLSKP